MNTGFLLQSKNKLEINTSPNNGEENYARLAKGISSMEPDPNEEIDQASYLDGDGFAESDVTGAQLIVSCDGHRYYGDEAQDFIYGLQMELGPARRTTFRLTLPDGSKFEGPVTVANIVGPGGEANTKGEISFELHFNGKPTYEPAEVVTE
ncbi:hypothetical protein J2Z83_003730 [Virgibacillus natechei]|uniref:Capsid protein n=2 Tax=Virgibacillus natechei TaxID=1216297 RepID=A0ABS4IKY1_9BACI|nr:capsid protein [Virgibacillus natechei]MBP1971579.1 hypothetical protein [Virgibacillus natechei]UZD14822.1 capsid protein [Virgibacillus natechei]